MRSHESYCRKFWNRPCFGKESCKSRLCIMYESWTALRLCCYCLVACSPDTTQPRFLIPIVVVCGLYQYIRSANLTCRGQVESLVSILLLAFPSIHSGSLRQTSKAGTTTLKHLSRQGLSSILLPSIICRSSHPLLSRLPRSQTIASVSTSAQSSPTITGPVIVYQQSTLPSRSIRRLTVMSTTRR
jgi:hypothetical protein